jgi:hypothetical protein
MMKANSKSPVQMMVSPANATLRFSRPILQCKLNTENGVQDNRRYHNPVEQDEYRQDMEMLRAGVNEMGKDGQGSPTHEQ